MNNLTFSILFHTLANVTGGNVSLTLKLIEAWAGSQPHEGNRAYGDHHAAQQDTGRHHVAAPNLKLSRGSRSPSMRSNDR